MAQSDFDAGRKLAEQQKQLGPQGNMPADQYKDLVSGHAAGQKK